MHYPLSFFIEDESISLYDDWPYLKTFYVTVIKILNLHLKYQSSFIQPTLGDKCLCTDYAPGPNTYLHCDRDF